MSKSNNGHWMEDMDLKRGALDKKAKNAGISTSKEIQKGLKSKSPTLKKEAVLAKTFSKLRKK